MTLPALPERPLVSVLMSVFNDEETLEETLRSVMNQSYSNFEFIIIDDGSRDSSSRILEKLAAEDSRIRVIRQSNTGLTIALNRAAALAQGALLARIDADDVCMADRFAQQVHAFAARADLVLLGSNSNDEYENGTVRLWGAYSDAAVSKRILLCTPFPHSSVMMRTDVFRMLGGYNENMKTSQDMELWMRFAGAGVVSMLAQPLIRRRVRKNSISGRKRFRQFRDALRARWRYYDGSKLYVLYFSLRSFMLACIPVEIIQILKPQNDAVENK
ncbi:MAG: glycosyltransferase [Alphaproteobacteria bacterium]|nr:glycosyltransferase [Alphaproteobacteria bacterium]